MRSDQGRGERKVEFVSVAAVEECEPVVSGMWNAINRQQQHTSRPNHLSNQSCPVLAAVCTLQHSLTTTTTVWCELDSVRPLTSAALRCWNHSLMSVTATPAVTTTSTSGEYSPSSADSSSSPSSDDSCSDLSPPASTRRKQADKSDRSRPANDARQAKRVKRNDSDQPQPQPPLPPPPLDARKVTLVPHPPSQAAAVPLAPAAATSEKHANAQKWDGQSATDADVTKQQQQRTNTPQRPTHTSSSSHPVGEVSSDEHDRAGKVEGRAGQHSSVTHELRSGGLDARREKLSRVCIYWNDCKLDLVTPVTVDFIPNGMDIVFGDKKQ